MVRRKGSGKGRSDREPEDEIDKAIREAGKKWEERTAAEKYQIVGEEVKQTRQRINQLASVNNSRVNRAIDEYRRLGHPTGELIKTLRLALQTHETQLDNLNRNLEKAGGVLNQHSAELNVEQTRNLKTIIADVELNIPNIQAHLGFLHRTLRKWESEIP